MSIRILNEKKKSHGAKKNTWRNNDCKLSRFDQKSHLKVEEGKKTETRWIQRNQQDTP